jgi:hypothetical protein
MRYRWELLSGAMVLDELLREKLITRDHYDHMWEIFNEKSDPVNYVLVDLPDVLLNLDQVDCEMIVNYLTTKENLKEFYTTKLAI